ncbi:MAG TPA: VacJ family lipoprotein [Opitutaceae bacterium]|jgi:phospholipid-binding lipoprotein MlaA
MKRFWRAAWPLIPALMLGSCASLPKDSAGFRRGDETKDPYEGWNRKVFAFNQVVDMALLRPIAEGYVHVVPPKGRDTVRNIVDNLSEPLVMANCLLQARWRDAGVTGGRLLVNTTIGIGGIRDVATQLKLKRQVGDFGQTLWKWDFAPGPYLILPVLGPSSPRDAIGLGVDAYMDPMRYVVQHRPDSDYFSIGRIAADGIDERARNLDALDIIKREAIDYYASFRSLYLQNRNADLTSDQPKRPAPTPGLYDSEQ